VNQANAKLDAEVIALDRKAQEPPKRRFTPVHWADLKLEARRDALIEGVLDAQAFSLWYGASGSRKSFLAIDIGGHVCADMEWRGRAVKSGRVVYIAAEGGRTFKERVIAFAHHHELDREAIPFHVIGEAPDLCHGDADTEALLEALADLPADPPLVLVIVDTLSRALAGGNENSPDDMGTFVRNCDRIRQETGAHLMVVHHSGKDDSRGARGHSLLKAAADTEVEITASGTICTATVTKQRDYPGGESLEFGLEEIRLGEDQRSVGVAVPADDGGLSHAQTSTGKRKRLTKAASIALKALQRAADEVGSVPPASNNIPSNVKTVTEDEWRKYAYALGISTGEERARQLAFQRSFQALIADSLAGAWQGNYWPCS
jgi:hypothetical protein